MHHHFAGPTLNQALKTFGYIGTFDLQEGGLNQREATSAADLARGVAHVVVRFRAATAMAHDQESG
jgi:hypothetical protein